MVNGGGAQRDSDPDGIGDELLDKWQERLSGGEDPVGALADVLGGASGGVSGGAMGGAWDVGAAVIDL